MGLPGLTGFPGPPGRKVRVFFSNELDHSFCSESFFSNTGYKSLHLAKEKGSGA